MEADPIQVLIVEDDHHVQALVQEVVNDLGHTTLCASNGAEALALYNERGADVVISDWMMPGLDGVQLCERLRMRVGVPYTYFILLTALGDAEHRLEAIQAGADDYLSKPFGIDDVEAALIVAQRVMLVHRRQESLLRMTRRFAAEADPARLVDELLNEAIELVGGCAGVVTRWDEEHKVMQPVAGTPGVTVGDVDAGLAVPLQYEGRVVGTLAIAGANGARTFSQQDAELLEMLASTAAAALGALERARLDGVLLAARTAQHELNNQLAVARGYAEILVGAPDLPKRLKPIATEVMSAADDAAGIVRQMRNIASIHEQQWNGPGDTTINLARSQRRRGAA